MSRYLDDQAEYLMERNGVYGTYPGRAVDSNPRGILRKPSDNYARPWAVQLPQTHSFASEMSEPSTGCGVFLDGFVRPAVAEFIAVFTAIFLFLHIDAELSQRHIVSVHRICVLSLVDAVCALAFIASFKTVQLNPAITIAQLFSLSTSWFICGVIFLCQLAGSTVAVAAHHALRSTGGRPQPITYNQDVTADSSTALYRMIVGQLIGTVLVIMSHMLSSVSLSRRSGTVRLGTFKEHPLCLFFSIGLASLINLLHSTLNWNPLLSLAISLYRFMTGDGMDAFLNLYIFWMGPVIGALLACFLFRILFTNDDRRLFRCGDRDMEAVNC